MDLFGSSEKVFERSERVEGLREARDVEDGRGVGAHDNLASAIGGVAMMRAAQRRGDYMFEYFSEASFKLCVLVDIIAPFVWRSHLAIAEPRVDLGDDW